MSAAATFGMYMGTKNGDTRLGPFSNRARAFSSNVWSPPVPVPTMAPTRFRSILSQLFARHASVTACSAAPTANCANRSKRRTSFLSRNRPGSKPLTSHANFTGLCTGSNRVIGPAPERPATRPSQVLCTSVPRGVTNPRPVIATRRVMRLFPHLFVEVLQRLSHRTQLLGFLVRNVDVEFLLEGHNQLHRVEAVRAQVLHEARFGGQFVALDPQLLDDDVLDLLLELLHVHCHGYPQWSVGKRSQHHPAVDDQHLTRNVAREVGREKEHCCRDIRALPQPAQRNRPDQRFPRVAGDGAGELRIDEPRGHRVHQDVTGGQFLGDGFGEADETGLGRGVVRLPLVPVDAHDARDIDDPPPAPLDHPPGRVLGHEERALQIRVDHGVPVVLADAEQQVVARGSGVVHDHVDAPEVPLHRGDRRLHLGGVAHVTTVAPRGAVRQRVRRRLGLGAVAPEDGHLRARHREGLRNRVPDAAAPARHHGDLSGQVDLHAASRNVATSSAVPRLMTLAPGTMRRNSPASTFPGPASMKRAPVPASSAARCMQDTHRTGAVSWSASRRRARVASRTGSAVALAITGNAGGWNGACSSATRRWFAAGAMRDEWNAPLTFSGTTRLAPRALHAAPAFATASGSPEITVWSGAFRFAATTTAPSLDAARHASSTCAVARPSTAAMVPGRSVPACCISSPRRRTRAAASVGASAPAAMYAEYSPRECPAAATAAPSILGPTTANTAALCARIAGCALWVAVSSSSGPSNIRRLSAKPSASSIASSVCRASGNRSARS